MNEFINQAIVFIGTTVIIVPIFKLLGFGSVLGYLTAGILVGPYSLGLIKDAESVMHFAELGVVFLLFIIGLEIQPKKLIDMRNQLLGLGFVQIILTTLTFTGLGIWFGLDLTIASIIAFGLSLSSTAFALQYLIEKNQFQMPFGQSSFAILLSQDLVAIPVLAIIPALVVTTGVSQSTISIATLRYFALLIVMLILSSRFLIRPFFRFEKAGIGKSKYLILAIDDFTHSLDTARIVHENYPHVTIFARARNRAHLFEYMELGVKMIKRETFDSALSFTGDLLKELGISEERTSQILQRFKTHDEAIIQEQFKFHKDESKFISLVHEGQKQLEGVMESESKQSFL